MSLRKQGFIEVLRGSALLGFVIAETLSGVLIAVHTVPKVTLPGGHIVHMVAEAQWVLTPLQRTARPTVVISEQEFWRLIQQNIVSGCHFFCETADISRPFPSKNEPFDADNEFVWNSWLSKPMRDLGLLRHCPCLLQGAVESADEINPTGQRYTITTISRRSRRHPGTRYLARGLNSYAGPGNEIEVELIVWKGADASNPREVQWCRTFWRRGTVPIWWGVEIQPLNKGLQAEVYVKDSGTYVGSLTYFRNLLFRAALEAKAVAESPVDPSIAGLIQPYVDSPQAKDSITCINLLHCNPKKAAELMLSSHFQEGMRHVKERMGQEAGASLRLLNFDWHGTMGSLSEARGVEAFWHFIEEPIKNVGFASGCMAVSGQQKGEDQTRWGDHWTIYWKQRQHGMLRFNCADSLDRTNAASCFAMLPVLQESLRVLGIPLDMTSRDADSFVKQSRDQFGPDSLPPGWEVRDHGGRLLYIDHHSRKTQWEHPLTHRQCRTVKHKTDDFEDSAAQWSFFNYSLHEVRVKMYPNVIDDYVSMFRRSGDIHSELYTGSAAMHSHILGIISSSESKSYGSTSSVGKLQNLKVAVQRRWNNTVSDAQRQQAIELFLGLNIPRHCPGLSVSSLQGDSEDDIFNTRLCEDEKEVAESHTISHLGEELRALGLTKHDGRLGLREDVDNEGAGDAVGDDPRKTMSSPHPSSSKDDILQVDLLL